MSEFKKVSFINSSVSSATDVSIEQDDSEEEEEEEIHEEIEEYIPNTRYLQSTLIYFESLQDEEFTNCINAVVRETSHLRLENQVFKDFIIANEPQLLAGLPLAMKTIKQLEADYPLLPKGYDSMEEPVTAISIIFSELGNRINVSSRIDLVLRCVEEMEENLRRFETQAHRAKYNMKAIIEESTLRIDETTEARLVLEEAMQLAIDPITQRVPAEKFIWFMDEWLKSARQITEKLRLRNSSLKNNYQKIKAMLEQKEEMGTSLLEVDFDKFQIENKYLKQKIEMANEHLVELKNFNGKANLDLATTKRVLHSFLFGIKTIKQKIDNSQQQIVYLLKECEIARKKLDEVKTDYEYVKAITRECHAPDTLEYVHVKERLFELLKERKVLSRKENLQDIVMKATMKSMLMLTGCKKFKKEWFLPHGPEEFDDIDFELELPPRSQSQLEPTVSREFDIFTVIKCGAKVNEPETPEVKRRALNDKIHKYDKTHKRKHSKK